jgi:hypothetical protein
VTGETPDALRTRIGAYLRDAGLDPTLDEQGDHWVRSLTGFSIVYARGTPWEGDHTLVRVWSVTNVDVRVDAELTGYLVTANARWPMGGFHLDEAGPAVIVTHTLLGDHLNRHELEAAVAAVAGAADQFGEEIRDRFGGSLFSES